MPGQDHAGDAADESRREEGDGEDPGNGRQPRPIDWRLVFNGFAAIAGAASVALGAGAVRYSAIQTDQARLQTELQRRSEAFARRADLQIGVPEPKSLVLRREGARLVFDAAVVNKGRSSAVEIRTTFHELGLDTGQLPTPTDATCSLFRSDGFVRPNLGHTLAVGEHRRYVNQSIGFKAADIATTMRMGGDGKPTGRYGPLRFAICVAYREPGDGPTTPFRWNRRVFIVGAGRPGHPDIVGDMKGDVVLSGRNLTIREDIAGNGAS